MTIPVRVSDKDLLDLFELVTAYRDEDPGEGLPLPMLRRSGAELTARQRDMLQLVAAGHTNAQIGRRLGISEGTVRKHMEHIYGRLQVSSRTAAVTRALGTVR